ncbi:putative bifunctional diguanylate cyclase/phosphodiesterase [Mangrovihabitans endophyticus]|uniref:Diguanylate cyclase (GGDEF) domain-containing protein n=1 Tax=Mangrovihabitans endophyticus TaxID=1751298 RepID=A0A8J3C475_9ACTN|nr:bifunctional diguanylate cyclase/phosphodiesterase [Mangrovihabitans endophyticus]GGL07232.1 hypothetical protein GCM10012284_46840 [Mangrovihabitans endophyticus]
MTAPLTIGNDVRPGRTPSGSDPLPRWNLHWVLWSGVVGAAALAAVLGLVFPGDRPPGAPLVVAGGAAVALTVVVAGQLARIRFRLGRGTAHVSWGEAAFIVAFVLVPPGWLPATTLLGATAVFFLLSQIGEARPPLEALWIAASLTLGATAGAVVASSIADQSGVPSGRLAVALAAGAATSQLVMFGVGTLLLFADRDRLLRVSLRQAARGKAPVFVGNVLVGLGVVTLLDAPWWLLGAPAVFWFLQRTYRYHLRGEHDRRTWAAFARAVAALPQPTQRQVVEAGLSGAVEIFAARRVEVDVLAPGGERHRRSLDAPGWEAMAADRTGPVVTKSMTVGRTPMGSLSVWLPDTTVPLAGDESVLSAYGDALAGAVHDVAAHERLFRLEARMARDLVHDPVTGLVNRSALLADGDTLLRSQDRDQQVAVLLLDLTKFSEVNRTLGHRAGDEVLALVAQRLLDLSRAGDLVARFGDDEFAVFVPAVAALASSATPLSETPNPLPWAMRRARELVDGVSQPMEVSGVRLVIEGAVGVAVGPASHADMAELVRRAALALGEAKSQQTVVAAYDSSRDVSSTDHLAMLADFRDALEADDELMIVMQPAVDLKTGMPTGVEALARWRHPRRGQLSPAVFISGVEDSQLLGAFTRYVLDRSLAAAADWSSHGVDLPVSVNVSARTLLDATFPSQVAHMLRRHRLPADTLVLEITESVAVSERGTVDQVLAALRESGVQLSVDDFGTGYSSLAFVTRVPVDEIKVDRSFVDQMIDSPAAEAVVRGAVELGERLGVRVVAEGVETAEQRAALIAMGCSSAQGYHFCRPLPPDRIVGALRRLAETADRARIVPLRADDAS